MENISLNIGEIIRDLRKAKGLTQESLAQAMGVSIQAVSKWETGQSLPDVTLLPVIADYFEISIDMLFGRSAPEPIVEKEAEVPLFPEDGRLRVVQFLGSQLLGAEECVDGKAIPLALEKYEGKLEVEILGSARISGAVNGAIHTTGGAYIEGDVNGSATAQGDLSCNGAINGTVRAQGNLNARSAFNLSALKDSLSGIRVNLSGLGGMFSGNRTGGAAGAQMNAFFRGELPDDDKIRIVQMQGRRIMSVEESAGEQIIRLSVEHITDPLHVEIYGSAQIEGNIHGNATSGDSMTCGNVAGNASAGDSMTCGEIVGNASAGDALRSGSIGGNATAGDGITCGSIGGNVRAGDSVQVSGDVGGDVHASDSVTCGNVQGSVRADSVKCGGMRQKSESFTQPMPEFKAYSNGALHIVQIMNGQVLSDEESSEGRAIPLCLDDSDGLTVHIHGSAQIEGDISGDVHANASVACGNVEGDVSAGGQVKCETVEGDVSAGGQVNCGSVEGDVSAGMSVNCGRVEGDVRIQGASDKCFISCEGIEGDVTAVNASVNCSGGICGSVDIRCDQPAPGSIACEGVEGDVTALNASVNCGGFISGDVEIRCDQPISGSIACAGIDGDVTALNASVKSDGAICGNVDIRCDEPIAGCIVCDGIDGNVDVINASVTCNGVICGDVDIRCEKPTVGSVTCASAEGDVTAINASVYCGGVIYGDIDAKGEE